MLEESEDSESLPEPEPDVEELSRRFFDERALSCRAGGGDIGFFLLNGGDGDPTRLSTVLVRVAKKLIRLDNI